MKKICISSLFMIILTLSIISVLAEINLTNSSYEYPQVANASISLKNNNTANNYNTTNPEIEKIEILSFIPKKFNAGDVQFNIRIVNNHTTALKNIVPIISGKGFSTYEIIPIDSLQPREKDYIIVSGNFKESGTISLTIKINEEIFTQDVVVENPNAGSALKEDEDKKNILANLSLQLSDLKQKYSELESDYFNKKDEEYDLSKVNLDDFKSYIHDIEIDITNEDVKNSIANIKLAYESYENQKKKLEASREKSSIVKLKENALIFSTIAGALITLFALSELLKNKSRHVAITIKKVGSGIIKKKK